MATLIRQVGDFQLAEDVLQDALAAGIERWGTAPPANPAAWILTVARRKALDRLRHRGVRERKRDELETIAELEQSLAPPLGDDTPIPDDTLRLLFTCCHPALALDARVALTLRTLGGLTTGEIGRAFLVGKSTMAQRLVRAKRKIKDANIPYRVPDAADMPERLGGVLAVLYLIFNEGYFPSRGEAPVREDLCLEALRLSNLLVELLNEPEAVGLWALMQIQFSRREARTDPQGRMIPLEEQDRSRWEHRVASRAAERLRESLRKRRPGPYQIQASIAALHSEAKSATDTDWPQIVLLYRELMTRYPSPVVELNLAVALSNLRPLEECLERINNLKGLEDYQPFHAARADLLRRTGARDEAVAAYERAIELTENSVTADFLCERMNSIREP